MGDEGKSGVSSAGEAVGECVDGSRPKNHPKLMCRRPYMVAIVALAVLVLAGMGFGVVTGQSCLRV